MTQITEISESTLVTRSAAGDRDAFTLLVERYQSLICAIAYNATGNLALSEDLSQEIFVTAWKHLADLHEPARFRPWLCGIARNLINNSLRAQRRHPTASLDANPEDPIDPPSQNPDPAATAISHEEESLLWRSLERIPEAYREPLILFYRQQQSLEQVAAALELSEDAVKQRLSRGRKLLQENLAVFVEHTLRRSNPGKAFALGVAFALPAVATSSAKAATLASTAATGSAAAAKGTTLLSVLFALLSPVMMIFGIWSGYRLSLETAKSDAQRRFIKSFYRIHCFGIAGFTVAFCLLLVYGKNLQHTNPPLLVTLVLSLIGSYLLFILLTVLWAQKNPAAKSATQAATDFRPLPTEEYRSSRTFLGVPLLHMRRHGGVNDPPAFAWFAFGDNARALLFAFGGTATAPIAIGGRAFGLFAWGGLAIGPFSMGGISLGIFSLGGIALGYQTFGGCSIAWDCAAGAVAIARNNADGIIVAAAHANDALSTHFFHSNWFFHAGNVFSDYTLYFNALWALPSSSGGAASKREKPPILQRPPLVPCLWPQPRGP